MGPAAANEVHDQQTRRRLIRLRVVTERTDLSRTTLCQLLADGSGPVTMKVGRRTRIGAKAAEAWRRRMEGAVTVMRGTQIEAAA
jgi:predicted DNA-binding transcriptional regulator AlpA